MRLHKCGDMEPRQLYPQGIRQVNDLESKPFGLSMKGCPAIYGNDATIFPIGYLCSQEMQAFFEVVAESPREDPAP